jgi:hypothetical protein
MTATNHVDPNKANCTAVTGSDWLQSIYIYNATGFKQHDTFWVSVAYNSDITDYTTLGMASFDAATNRIVYDGSSLGTTVCLSNVFRIALRNLTPVTPPSS